MAAAGVLRGEEPGDDSGPAEDSGPGFVDADRDGMPDEWELEHFGDLSAGPGEDPDGDSLSNLFESEIGTDPTRADTSGDGTPDWVGVPGSLYQEIWPERDRDHPRDYYPRHLFDAPADSVFFHPGAAVRAEGGKYFRQRLRGRITAPATGDYVFRIAGSNTSELWLGEDESRFTARRLARVRGGPHMSTGPRHFDRFPDQRSEPVRLVEGREY